MGLQDAFGEQQSESRAARRAAYGRGAEDFKGGLRVGGGVAQRKSDAVRRCRERERHGVRRALFLCCQSVFDEVGEGFRQKIGIGPKGRERRRNREGKTIAEVPAEGLTKGDGIHGRWCRVLGAEKALEGRGRFLRPFSFPQDAPQAVRRFFRRERPRF